MKKIGHAVAGAICTSITLYICIGIILAWGVYYLVGSIKKKRKKADVCIAGETDGTTESSETNE